MYYVCHNTHILVKGKMKKDEKNEEKKRMNPWFYAIFWLSRQKLARLVTRTFCPTAKGCGITARQPFRLTSFVYPSARTTFPSSVHSIATRTRELSRQA